MTYLSRNSGHSDSLEVGHQFQDVVCMKLAKSGIILQNLNSKKFQLSVGENLQGFEIKYDSRCTGDCTFHENTATGRLSIEIAEKTNGKNPNWVDSGIFREDNTWLYIQGNFHQFWIFSKKILRGFYNSRKPLEHLHPKESPTVKKFYISISDADKYSSRRFDL